MNRGNHGQRSFQDDDDRERYVSLLQDLYVEVLMDNHFHSLVEVGEFPLAKGMHNFAVRYARHYNRCYQQASVCFRAGTRSLRVTGEVIC